MLVGTSPGYTGFFLNKNGKLVAPLATSLYPNALVLASIREISARIRWIRYSSGRHVIVLHHSAELQRTVGQFPIVQAPGLRDPFLHIGA